MEPTTWAALAAMLGGGGDNRQQGGMTTPIISAILAPLQAYQQGQQFAKAAEWQKLQALYGPYTGKRAQYPGTFDASKPFVQAIGASLKSMNQNANGNYLNNSVNRLDNQLEAQLGPQRAEPTFDGWQYLWNWLPNNRMG